MPRVHSPVTLKPALCLVQVSQEINSIKRILVHTDTSFYAMFMAYRFLETSKVGAARMDLMKRKGFVEALLSTLPPPDASHFPNLLLPRPPSCPDGARGARGEHQVCRGRA